MESRCGWSDRNWSDLAGAKICLENNPRPISIRSDWPDLPAEVGGDHSLWWGFSNKWSCWESWSTPNLCCRKRCWSSHASWSDCWWTSISWHSGGMHGAFDCPPHRRKLGGSAPENRPADSTRFGPDPCSSWSADEQGMTGYGTGPWAPLDPLQRQGVLEFWSKLGARLGNSTKIWRIRTPKQ